MVDRNGQPDLPASTEPTKIQLNENDSTLTWTVKTDFTDKPVRLVVDTGSQIGLTDKDRVKSSVKIAKPIYHLTGVAGQEHKVSTDGHLIGNFITDDNTKWLTSIHLVNKRNTGQHDGYLGLDFLKKYKAKIDVHNKILELHEPDVPKCMKRPMEQLTSGINKNRLNNSQITEQNDHTMKSIVNASDTKTKRVSFASPIENVEGEIRIDDISIQTCDTSENGECETCQSNRINLPKNWIDTESKNVNSISTITPPQDAGQFIREIEQLKFADSDSDLMKLEKVERNKLRIPVHAKQYLNAFSPVNENLQMRNVRQAVIVPGMTREQYILANLPTSHCTSEDKLKIKNLVFEFPFQFYAEGDKLAKTDIIQHKIYLKPGAPISFTRQFRLSEAMRQSVLKETKELESQEIIRRSVSPFNSPAFMVGKGDEMGTKTDQRFVVNYIKVNEYTELRDFPIPRID